MRFRRKCSVGPYEIEIWEVPALKEHGTFSCHKHPWRINIRMEDPEEEKQRTELHEILHAIEQAYRVLTEDDVEELKVRVLEMSLSQAGVRVPG